MERAEVAAARRGDLAAFNRLVERYQRLAYNVAYRTLGQSEEAADATQEAFISAFRAMGGSRGDSFKAWLLRIVVNCCYDQLRRRQRQPTDSIEAIAEQHQYDPPLADRRPGPEPAALSRETAEAIQRALGTLPPDQRMVVVLCDVQGLSYEEAASAPLNLKQGHRYVQRREPYFFDYVQEQLIERYGVGVVRRGGLRIHTTINPKMQDVARDAINAYWGDPAGPSSAIVAIDPANGAPLYRFSGDIDPGDTAGHGFNELWLAVAPDGQPIALESEG